MINSSSAERESHYAQYADVDGYARVLPAGATACDAAVIVLLLLLRMRWRWRLIRRHPRELAEGVSPRLHLVAVDDRLGERMLDVQAPHKDRVGCPRVPRLRRGRGGHRRKGVYKRFEV